MRAILFKPVTKFMANRQAAVQADIEAAEKQKADALLVKNQYDEQLARVKEETAALIKAAQTDAEKQADIIIANAKEEARARLVAADEKIKAERAAAQATFRNEAAALVIAAAAKLLQREFSDEDRRKEAALILADLSRGVK
jgi:F-type H+-transporting ATPase subunit b